MVGLRHACPTLRFTYRRTDFLIRPRELDGLGNPSYGVPCERSGFWRNDQIVQLLTNVQQQLTRYVRTLVPNQADAEEVLQETNLFVWRHADDLRWGRTSRPGRAKSPTTRCSPTASGGPAAGSSSATGWSSNWPRAGAGPRRAARQRRGLRVVRGEVGGAGPGTDRLAYEPGATVQSVAQQVGRSTKAVYHALGRIRTWLLECMNRDAAGRRRG